MRANMLIVDGGRQTKASEESKNANDALDATDPNKAFSSRIIKTSHADTVTSTHLSNLNLTIAQGKIIDAVIETAVNTDLPSTIRAIVSRDTYAESGRQVMIPMLDRALSAVIIPAFRAGQRRVMIVWTRLIRPDGVDIAIGSSGVDPLGRGGIEGNVDNKFSEIFSAALLTSLLDIGVAVAVEAVSNQNSTTTTNANGTTSTGGAAAPAGAAAVSTIGNVGKDIVNTMLDLRPTITIDQGTRINVFVNRDLVFPGLVSDSAFTGVRGIRIYVLYRPRYLPCAAQEIPESAAGQRNFRQ